MPKNQAYYIRSCIFAGKSLVAASFFVRQLFLFLFFFICGCQSFIVLHSCFFSLTSIFLLLPHSLFSYRFFLVFSFFFLCMCVQFINRCVMASSIFIEPWNDRIDFMAPSKHSHQHQYQAQHQTKKTTMT